MITVSEDTGSYSVSIDKVLFKDLNIGDWFFSIDDDTVWIKTDETKSSNATDIRNGDLGWFDNYQEIENVLNADIVVRRA